MRTDQAGIWLYAVADRLPAFRLAGLTGIRDVPLRALDAGRLTAVASDVQLSEFGEAALRRNLEDLDWLEGVARAHHRVVEALAERAPVVPMRLATVYTSEAAVTGMLAERAADLAEALRRISSCQEWGVKTYADPRQRAQHEADAADRPAGDAPARSGVAYLQRRRRELSEQRDSRQELTDSADLVHARLCDLALDWRLHPPQAPQLTGSTVQMVLNATYLLDECQAANFAAAVAVLGQEQSCLRLDLTGPWPPYSFAEVGDGSR
ncbi:MAG TPA: GvpL/GvpF family gas vesicle protein [Streptosporangiaceae bacterium]|jgi:hypothetical protein